MRQIRAAKEAAKVGLEEALPVITEALTYHWSTGGGRRMRQIVWSIWNGSTLISLWDVLCGLDYKLGRAAAKLIEAKLMGALESDEILRRMLEDSGEFTRYDEAAAETPEGEEVIYPPLAVSAERLRELAGFGRSQGEPDRGRTPCGGAGKCPVGTGQLLVRDPSVSRREVDTVPPSRDR